MTKYILIMKICSALYGECLPEHNAGVHKTWYDCAAVGTMMTATALSEMGPKMVNENKMYVTFKCDPIVGA